MNQTTMLSMTKLLDWHETMNSIWAFEENALDLFSKGQISRSTHPCIAQEAISVGARTELEPQDSGLGDVSRARRVPA